MRYILIIFISIVLIISCHKSTDPLPDWKNPRDLTWTIDTLNYDNFQTNMKSIWGSSAYDVWTVGHNAAGEGQMFHYDGKRWNVVILHGEDGDIAGPIDLWDITGFAPDNIWAMGERIYHDPRPDYNYIDSSLIIHYDGVKWSAEEIQKKRRLFTIGGNYPDHFWAGGQSGSLYRYHQDHWEPDSLVHSCYNNPDYKTSIVSITGNDDHGYYATCFISRNYILQYYLLFKYINNSWEVQDSTYKIGSMWMSPNGVLYCASDALRIWEGPSNISIILDNVHLNQVFGISDDNIFAVGKKDASGPDWPYGRASLFHFNGENWYSIPGLKPDTEDIYTGVWSDGREVFVVGYNISSFPENSFVLHGK